MKIIKNDLRPEWSGDIEEVEGVLGYVTIAFKDDETMRASVDNEDFEGRIHDDVLELLRQAVIDAGITTHRVTKWEVTRALRWARLDPKDWEVVQWREARK